jgi:hypothetical protein
MHIHRKLVALLAVAGTAIAASPAAASVGVDTSKTYRITTSTSLALDIAGASRGDGAPLIQWGVNGGANQQWRFVALGGTHYNIVNVNSGKCLTSPGGSTTPGTGLVQWTCGRAGQDWLGSFLSWGTASSNQVVSFTLGASQMAIDVPGGSGLWGTQLATWYVNGQANQSLFLTPLN